MWLQEKYRFFYRFREATFLAFNKHFPRTTICNMGHSSAPSQSAITKRERFLRAIRRQPIDRPPVWLMRQAGRYLPQYQEIKKNYSFKDLCRIPEIAAEISVQPYDIFGVDAIIVFNDILIPLEYMGFSVSFSDLGPEIEPALRSEDAFANIQRAIFNEMPPVSDTIKNIRKRVGSDVPILGFVGGPFTMASYAVEGKITKNLIWVKTIRYSNPSLLKRLLELITETAIEYLAIQIEAGADAVQIFDTWASGLTPADYLEFALPYQRQIIRSAQEKRTPAILYVNCCGPYLAAMSGCGMDVLSVDWRLDLRTVYDYFGRRYALQGNLDPGALCGPPDSISALTRAMLDRFGQSTGHIVNLGHGVLPTTPVEGVHAFVEAAQSYDYGSLT